MPESNKAFISYSHSADAKLAPAIQQSLERFAKPWYLPRAFRIFHDTTNLVVSPHVWPDIEAELKNSEYLILLASPEAADSKWVRKEIDFWFSCKPPETLLIVLTSGTIRWDERHVDFDWKTTTALPSNLAGKFAHEPLYLDFSELKGRQFTISDNDFLERVASLAAKLRGTSKDAVFGEHLRQHRRTIRLVRGALALISVLFLLACGAAWLANEQRKAALLSERKAQYQRDVSNLERQAALALNRTIDEPKESLREITSAAKSYLQLQSIEGSAYGGLTPGEKPLLSTALASALIQALHQCREMGAITCGADSANLDIANVDYSSNSQQLAVASRVTSLFVTDLRTQQFRIVDKASPSPLTSVSFDSTGEFLAAGAEDGSVVILATKSGERVRSWQACRESQVTDLWLSNGGRTLWTAGSDGHCLPWEWDGSSAGKGFSVVPGILQVAAGADDGPIVIWNRAVSATGFWAVKTSGGQGTPIWFASGDALINAVALDKNGTFVVTGHANGQIKFWDLGGKAAHPMIVAHHLPITAVCVLDGIGAVACGTADGRVGAWRFDGSLLFPLSATSSAAEIRSVSTTSEAANLVSVGEDSQCRLWDVRGLQCVAPIQTPFAPEVLQFVADGNCIAGGLNDGSIALWDWETARLLKRAHLEYTTFTHLVTSPTGHLVAAHCIGSRKVHVLDIPSLDPIAMIELPAAELGAMALRDAPDALYFIDQDRGMYVASSATGWKAEFIRSISVPEVGSENQSLQWLEGPKVFALSTGVPTILREDGTIAASLASGISSNGNNGLATWSADGAQRFVYQYGITSLDFAELKEGRLQRSKERVRIVSADEAGVGLISFSPPQKTIALAATGASFSLLDSEGEVLLPPIPAHGAQLEALSAHPEIPIVATGGHDRLIHFWATGQDVWFDLADHRLSGEMTTHGAESASRSPERNRVVQGNAGAARIDGSGIFFSPHANWTPVPETGIAAVNELLRQIYQRKASRITLQAGYIDRNQHSSGGILNQNQAFLFELRESDHPEYYASNLAKWFSRITQDASRYHVGVKVGKGTMNLTWHPRKVMVSAEADLATPLAPEGMGRMFWRPTVGSALFVVAVVTDHSDRSLAFLREVEAQFHSASIRLESELSPDRMTELGTLVEFQAGLIAVHSSEAKIQTLKTAIGTSLANQDFTQALRSARDYLAIIDDALSRPGVVRAGWDLHRAEALCTLGKILSLVGQTEEGERYVADGLDLSRSLVAAFPVARSFQNHIRILEGHRSHMFLNATPLEVQLSIADELVETCQKHTAENPNPSADRAVANAFRSKAGLLRAMNRPDEAILCAEHSLMIVSHLVTEDPNHAEAFETLCVILNFLCDLERGNANRPAATAYAERWVEAAKQFVALRSNSQVPLNQLSDAWWKLAVVRQEEMGVTSSVLSAADSSLKVLKDLESLGSDTTSKRRKARESEIHDWKADLGR